MFTSISRSKIMFLRAFITAPPVIAHQLPTPAFPSLMTDSANSQNFVLRKKFVEKGSKPNFEILSFCIKINCSTPYITENTMKFDISFSSTDANTFPYLQQLFSILHEIALYYLYTNAFFSNLHVVIATRAVCNVLIIIHALITLHHTM